MKILPLHDEPPEEARAELEERAAALRERPQEEDDVPTVWVAEFPVGSERCAIPLERMRAVLPLRGVTPLPLAPSHVLGLLRFEGRALSAHSLAALLGVRGWTRDPSVLVVVEDGVGGLVAFDCERVPIPRALPLSVVQEARKGEVLPPGEPPLRLLDVPALFAGEVDRVR
ncbi:chemotaxis protein CheW [Vitiosangium sp. GDMCC 1.1324]|uniref:chemotaxis protein CheW n=1 Tax=Vitiosangium sp. (strain GDMCC 1.1324) TaxID=2138576 RepID=UPI000D37D85A|nr:chemotaxis protein CheW [Vitiosangium sp. GDMCC 1.1324]PTL84434.1 hypothetical protein DAT35_04900 [Vitiosangium sp. GDMCC 1.1324]